MTDTPPVPPDEEVLAGKGVSVRAVGFPYVLCNEAHATNRILATGDGFKVSRIHALAVAAQVVEM